MKIVSFSYVGAFEYSDPQKWISRIKPYLGIMEELGKMHEVVRIEQINYSGELYLNNIKYYFINLGKKKHRFPRKLHKFVKQLDPDVVVINGLHFPLQILQLRRSLGKRVKIIAQNHAERPFSGWKKWLQRLADKQINAYLFASKTVGEDWVKGGNLSDINKIHEVMEVSSIFSPVDREMAKHVTGVKGDPSFLWVGRLDKNKDPLTVVSAFLEYLIAIPTASLHMIYGQDDLLNEVRNTISNKSGGNKAISLIGRLPHKDLLHWYNSADFFVSASHYEGSGAAACEAMSCGCIPILSNIPSFRMMTNNGECGILFEAGNKSDLLAAFRKAGTIDREKMRNLVKQQYESKLSFKAIADRIYGIVSSL